MAHVYILKNQHDLYLNKHRDWVDQADAQQLFSTARKDEAINSMVELSVKHPDLRVKIETCVLTAKGQLVLGNAPAAQPEYPAIDQDDEALFAEDTTSATEIGQERTQPAESCAILADGHTR